MAKLELKKLIREVVKENNIQKTNEIIEDEIPGGKGDNAVPEDFDPKEMEMGIKTELEHTDDKEKAKEIAMDHLTEDPKYYSKLKGAGLADELEESIRKEIRSIIKEYYNDEQATKFIDAVLDLLNASKNALSTDMEKQAEKYFSTFNRTASGMIQQLQNTTKFIRKIQNWK